jgi:hypothetical protein
MTDKQVDLTPQEVAENPILSMAVMGAFMELLGMALAAELQQMMQPQVLDLGMTERGSALDQALSTTGRPVDLNAGANGENPAGGNAAVTDNIFNFDKGNTSPVGGKGSNLSNAAVTSDASGLKIGQINVNDMKNAQSGGISAMMQAMGMNTFRTTVKVYEPGSQAVVASQNGGGGGIKVNSQLKGNSINIKMPKLIAKGEDGKLYNLSSLTKTGDGVYSSHVKGESKTGAGGPAQSFFVDGSNVQVIPGTKAA